MWAYSFSNKNSLSCLYSKIIKFVEITVSSLRTNYFYWNET